MKTIYKYELDTIPEQTLSIPEYNEPLFVKMQRGVPCIWFLVNPDTNSKNVKIKIYGTGHNIPDTAFKSDSCNIQEQYVGSFMELSENLVWHVFVCKD